MLIEGLAKGWDQYVYVILMFHSNHKGYKVQLLLHTYETEYVFLKEIKLRRENSEQFRMNLGPLKKFFASFSSFKLNFSKI